MADDSGGARASATISVSTGVSIVAVLISLGSLAIAWLSYQESQLLPAEVRFVSVSANPAAPPTSAYVPLVEVVNRGDRAAIGCNLRVMFEDWDSVVLSSLPSGIQRRTERIEPGESETFEFGDELAAHIAVDALDAVTTEVICERGGSVTASWGGAGFAFLPEQLALERAADVLTGGD